MPNETPRFSILITNFNYATFVGQAIRSALDQNYPADRFQVVVVDDGSTDGSRQVIESFSADPRLLAIFQTNRGQSAAFETGLLATDGDYVCLLDSDDLFLPDKLTRVAARLQQLGLAHDRVLLCHDLFIENSIAGHMTTQSWFDVVGISRLPDQWTLNDPVQSFPFSVPCGLVFSRAVMASVLAAMPTWAFPRGTDGVLCPAAFLQVGSVHYLREKLGVYRVHGGNEFANLVNDVYIPKLNWRERTPRTLRFLYEWLDLLDQPAAERAVAMDYLRRVEHQGRILSASRQPGEPTVNILHLAAPATQKENSHLTHSLQSHGRTYLTEIEGNGLPELIQMAQAYASSKADYILFLRQGDCLDRECIERHVQWRLQGALVGVSCNDVRLVSRQGHIVHADVFRNSGAWKQDMQQIPPLATRLNDWVAPPMSACLFRRTALLDRLFARAAETPVALQHAGFWLAFQLTHHTSGVLRIRDTLTTCTLPDGAAESYGYLSAPAADGGALLLPPIAETVDWFRAFYQAEAALFRQWLPPAWHQRFSAWLASHPTLPSPR